MLSLSSLYFSDSSGSNLFFVISLLLSHGSRISAMTQSFASDDVCQGFAGCFNHCCVEGGDHWIHDCIFIFHNGEKCKLPVYHSLEGFQQSGTLNFCVFWLADSFQAMVEGHHRQVVITSNGRSWKTSSSGTIHSWSEALPHWNVINLIVVLSIWAMSGPSSGCFVMTKSVRQHKIVKGGKLQKSEFSLICIVIAEGSTKALPVSTSILAHFCIPVSLHNKNVLLGCQINDNL